jgi:hypothetical protein
MMFLLLTKYYPSNQIKKNEIDGACSTYGERRISYWAVQGKPERKVQLSIPIPQQENTIKVDIQEITLRRVDRITLAQGRDRYRSVMNAVMNPLFL